uniref:DNA-directed RNA polymerase RpoA/D/Rpb3-type domain-containing protein n=1 Tax=viral metagenome TaxID=1070528 RepID=A0A6C0ETC9_9ZZZZ
MNRDTNRDTNPDIGNEQVLNLADGENLTFELLNIDVAVVNALRRVILTQIESLVFRGFPHHSNKIKITKNNTKFNNEYIKHRISCIPIYEPNDARFESIKNTCEVRLSVANNDNKTLYVTTQDFKLFNKESNKEIKDHTLFPADPISGGYIPICCLMSKISETDEPEEIKMTIDFDTGIAKEDSCWNVVSKCMFVNMKDDAKIEKDVKRLALKEEDERDFRILDSQRIFIPFHYLMTVGTIGVYENQDIVIKACEYIKMKIAELNTFLTKQSALTETSFTHDKYGIFEDTTSIKPLYYIRIENDDYTIGKLIEKYLFYMFAKEIYYVAFKKDHPHDTHCYVHFAYKDIVDFDKIVNDLSQVTEQIERIYNKIEQSFRKK